MNGEGARSYEDYADALYAAIIAKGQTAEEVHAFVMSKEGQRKWREGCEKRGFPYVNKTSVA